MEDDYFIENFDDYKHGYESALYDVVRLMLHINPNNLKLFYECYKIYIVDKDDLCLKFKGFEIIFKDYLNQFINSKNE